MFSGRTITTLVMLAIFAGASVLALDLPAKARFFPLLIGIPGALLCAWQLVLDLRRASDPPETAAQEAGAGRSEAEVFVWLALFFGTLAGFGFILGAPLIVTAFVRFSSRESWQNALFAGAGTFAVMYGVFIWLLELSLFQGLVLEWLF